MTMIAAALGPLAGDEDRLAERGCLFLDPAGVGDHEVGAAEQAGEGRVAERLGEKDVAEAVEALGQDLAQARVGVHGEHAVDVRMGLRDAGDALGDPA